MPKLLEAPFWLDPSDPHRMALGHAASDAAAGPRLRTPRSICGTGRWMTKAVWAKAVHRVVTENISPEQAVDEAIARIKQILSE